MEKKIKSSEVILKEVMTDLLKKKDFSKITVKELCENANVNRSTFYASFKDIYDILQSLHFDLFARTSESIKNEWRAMQRTDEEKVRETIIKIVRSVKQNGDLYLLYTNNPNDNQFEMHLIKYYKGKIKGENYPLVYHTIGCFAMIFTWLANGCEESCEEIAGIIYEQSKNFR